MANLFTPNGFRAVRRYDGAAWAPNVTQYKISSTNTHKIYYGDPVIRTQGNTTGNFGYIDGGTAISSGTAPTNQGLLGIFVGCERLSTATGSKIWSNQWSGGDAQADVDAWVIDDPWVVYRIWCGNSGGTITAAGTAGGPVTAQSVGLNAAFAMGVANTYSGISGAYLDTNTSISAGNPTYPLVIVGLYTQPPGINGTDITTAGNVVEVLLNQSAFKAGVTGVA